MRARSCGKPELEACCNIEQERARGSRRDRLDEVRVRHCARERYEIVEQIRDVQPKSPRVRVLKQQMKCSEAPAAHHEIGWTLGCRYGRTARFIGEVESNDQAPPRAQGRRVTHTCIRGPLGNSSERVPGVQLHGWVARLRLSTHQSRVRI